MSNKMERIIVYTAASWQILDGFITIFIYGPYIRNKGANINGLSFEEKRDWNRSLGVSIALFQSMGYYSFY